MQILTVKIMKIKLQITATVAMSTALGLFGFPAQAADFILSGTSGIWTNADEVSNVEGIGTNEVRFGVPSQPGGEQSGLRFDGGVGALDLDVDEAFRVGTLTHFNNDITNNATKSADLQLTLDFSVPESEEQFSLTFQIDETQNTPSPPTCCADTITFPGALPSKSFSLMDQDYTLELLGFGNTPDELVSTYFSEEDDTNSILLFGQILEAPGGPEPPVGPAEPASVPEPATVGGLGLLGLYFIRRRQKEKAVLSNSTK